MPTVTSWAWPLRFPKRSQSWKRGGSLGHCTSIPNPARNEPYVYDETALGNGTCGGRLATARPSLCAPKRGPKQAPCGLASRPWCCIIIQKKIGKTMSTGFSWRLLLLRASPDLSPCASGQCRPLKAPRMPDPCPNLARAARICADIKLMSRWDLKRLCAALFWSDGAATVDMACSAL